ncbi:MAG: hypothetical protein KF802_10290 [Bdellovibrionaceae bacterium]|nr:hypothetical protein [Pseudobdellovibrionaceae bacterium]MBX3033799.1 hypothetical protein [Pseudobdellovibrionaceae bacterium]
MSEQKLNIPELEESFDEVAEEVRAFVREKPLMAVLGALLIGFVLAWIFTPKGRQ